MRTEARRRNHATRPPRRPGWSPAPLSVPARAGAGVPAGVRVLLGALLACLVGALPAAAAGDEPPAAPADRPAPAASPAPFAVEDGDTLWMVEEIVVWGDRIHGITDHGTRVDVIGRSQVERAERVPGANVLTAVATLPGVAYRKVELVGNGASGDPPAAFRIRGVGSIPNDGLLVMVDGRPQYVGVWGHSLPDAHQLGPVERIEVVRGPASVQFGSQAFGGVVNVITAAGGGGAAGSQLLLQGGNHGTYEGFLGHRARRGPLTLGLSASRSRSDGYRGGDAGGVDALRGEAALDLPGAWRLVARAEGSDSAFDNPGPEVWASPDPDPYLDPDWGSGDIRQRALDLTLEGEGDGWSARLKAYHNYVHNDFYLAGDTRARDRGLRLVAERRRAAWSLKGGLDVERYGGEFAVNGDAAFVPVEAHDTNTAPYLLARRDLGSRLAVSGGLRLNLSDRYDGEWIPQARLVAEVAPRTRLTLSAAEGFKTPSVAQQYLPFYAGDRYELEPERLWQYELGLSRDGDRWSGELAVYHAEGSNLIRSAGPGWPPVYDNSGAFRHQGAELALRGDLGAGPGARPAAGGSLAISWMWRRDAQTLATPAWGARSDLWWRPRGRLRLEAGLEAELDRYGADGAAAPLPDLFLVSAGLVWEALDAGAGAAPAGLTCAELFLSVQDLFDVPWQVFAGYPMPGRLWTAGLRLSR